MRRVRCIDVFSASFIIAATAAGESIYHDTLDVLVALLHSAGENVSLFVSARMTSSARTRRSHFV